MQYEKAAMRRHRKAMGYQATATRQHRKAKPYHRAAMRYPNGTMQHGHAIPDGTPAANACHIAVQVSTRAPMPYAEAAAQDASTAREDPMNLRVNPMVPMPSSKAVWENPFTPLHTPPADKDGRERMQGYPLAPMPYSVNAQADASRVPRSSYFSFPLRRIYTP